MTSRVERMRVSMCGVGGRERMLDRQDRRWVVTVNASLVMEVKTWGELS